MQRKILLFSAIAIWATGAQAQTTTYGGGSLPLNMDNGYTSDHTMGLFNRSTGARVHSGVISTIVNAAQ